MSFKVQQLKRTNVIISRSVAIHTQIGRGKRSKMDDIFLSTKITLKIAGLSMNPIANKYCNWLPYFWLFGTFALVPPSVDYIFRFRPDLAKATFVICFIVALLQVVIKFLLLWSRVNSVMEIFDAFQAIVNKRKYFLCDSFRR